MNRLLLSLMLMLCMGSATAQGLALATGGTSVYKIVAPQNPRPEEQRAVNALQHYLLQATGARLPVVSENNAGNSPYTIHVGTKEAGRFTAGVKDDGYCIVTKNNQVYIAGIQPQGTLYGVYGLLDKYLDIQLLAPGVWHIPKLSKAVLPGSLSLVQNPAFILRDISNDLTYSEEMQDAMAINHWEWWWGIRDHTFFKLVPPEAYLKSHPEYYSLIQNQRLPQQLCFSNVALLRKITDTLKVMMRNDPGKKFWMVGQEDMGGFCQCSQCTALYNKYGSTSGGLLFFINKIAAAFPDKIISTFAYHETLAPPPRNIKPASNVLICFAPIEGFHERPYNADPGNAITTYLKGWQPLSKLLMVWDYPDNYADLLMPYPTIGSYQGNMQLYRSSGVRYVFQWGFNKAGGELKELKTFLLSRLAWDPSVNQEQLIRSFCTKYYGNAAQWVISYLSAINANLSKEKDNLRFWGYTTRYLGDNYLAQYDNLLNKAATAVKNDPVLLNRVNLLRLSIDYAILNSKESKTLDRPAKEELKKRKDRVAATATANKVIWIIKANQWMTVDQYLQKAP